MSKDKNLTTIAALIESVAELDVFLSNLKSISEILSQHSYDNKLGILNAFIQGDSLTLCNPLDDDEQEFVEFMQSEFEPSHPIWNHFEVSDDFIEESPEALD